MALSYFACAQQCCSEEKEMSEVPWPGFKEDSELEQTVNLGGNTRQGVPRCSVFPENVLGEKPASIDGPWCRKADLRFAATIRGGMLFYDQSLFRQAPAYKVAEYGSGRFELQGQGEARTGQVRDSDIFWDDGEEWVRFQSRLQGEWYRESDGQFLGTVKGGKVKWSTVTTWPGESCPSQIMESSGKVIMSLNGDDNKGVFEGDKISWNNGMQWVRKRNLLDGDWYRQADWKYLASIQGGYIVWPTLPSGKEVVPTPISMQRRDSGAQVAMNLQGIPYEGSLQHSEAFSDSAITWSDGEVWIRVSSVQDPNSLRQVHERLEGS
eukprot:TRINITY_DN91359_c0_g1_i1.p1 TRINITY_DN91359_c0_g1~~TRINITY_DN91359_c0_g1_i1.p1  ORF type:complete len:323 (-),score=55.87 TRINITY_DN91359_c0_g1_i1:18-986(-)